MLTTNKTDREQIRTFLQLIALMNPPLPNLKILDKKFHILLFTLTRQAFFAAAR
jgi:hypothetical protein